MKIGNWKLIRLANRNELSLELRHQWFMRTRHDPYNVAVRNVRNDIASAFALLSCLSLAAVLFGALFLNEKALHVGSLITLFFGGIGFLFWLATGRYPGNQAFGFGVTLGDFSKWINIPPQLIVSMTLPELRKLAEGVLVSAARYVLEQQGLVIDRGNPNSVQELADLMKDLKYKYDTFESLGLAHGGYKHFYDEAERQCEEEKKVMAASAGCHIPAD